jgi:hypothetical protein
VARLEFCRGQALSTWVRVRPSDVFWCCPVMSAKIIEMVEGDKIEMLEGRVVGYVIVERMIPFPPISRVQPLVT